jgi:ATP-dependent DNA helicase RecG
MDLKGVGSQLAKKLAQLQITTFQDLLFHLPMRYVDRTRIHPLNTVLVDDPVVIEVEVVKTTVIPKPRRNLSIKVRDADGFAELRFFHFNSAQQTQFQPGTKVRCFGQARLGRTGLQFIHPEYKIIQKDTLVPVEEYLTPIYPATDGVSQKLLRTLVAQVLTVLQPIQNSLDILPAKICAELNFMPLFECLQHLHFPTPDFYKEVLNTGVHPAQRRLAFEELLTQHLSLRQKRQRHMQLMAHQILAPNILGKKLLQNLPFALTTAQQNAIAIIQKDLTNKYPMLRLVQGDVGSGKTLVAVMAALAVIEAGFQVAFMAPTEILAEQHYQNIKKWCEPLGVNVACLTGSLSAKEKSVINTAVKNSEIQLLLGTHALFQETVSFENLALVIIDEQHRFGVAQRLALHNKAHDKHCHQLILTATPIPRTLAMTFYADLDYTVIDELPPGRKPITTLLVGSERRTEVLQRIANLCQQGQQVYWVCTLIEESEVLECTPAEVAYQELQQQMPQLGIALIHGKMPAALKEQTMQEFKQGNIDLLVATTVIEVGVDVPNASLMVIENPERLGLAQLHQLRGRVGRGALQSYCILLYKRPLSAKAAQRLQFLRDSQDGFALAEFDLKLRGPGEVFGTKQSGLANLRIADLMRDKDLMPKVFAVAEILIQEYPNLIPALMQRWLRQLEQYAVV